MEVDAFEEQHLNDLKIFDEAFELFHSQMNEINSQISSVQSFDQMVALIQQYARISRSLKEAILAREECLFEQFQFTEDLKRALRSILEEMFPS